MKFTQEEIETELSDAVPRGIRKEIAATTGIYPSIMYAYLSADNERKSPQFETLLIQSAMDNSDNPEVCAAGEAHWQKLCILREMSLPSRGESACVDTEVAKHQQESTDVVIARLHGKPLYRQLIEIDQAIKQAKKTKQAIIDAINQEKAAPNGGRTRLNGSGAVEFRRAK